MRTSRRGVIGGAAAIGAGAVLAACAGAGTETPQGTSNPTPPPPERAEAGTALGKASDVPVGSAVVLGKVVISQPRAGEFKAFDSTCTHKGCPVKKIEGDTITCPCHGSQFSVLDGSVTHGPATRPLAEVTVVERGGELFTA